MYRPALLTFRPNQPTGLWLWLWGCRLLHSPVAKGVFRGTGGMAPMAEWLQIFIKLLYVTLLHLWCTTCHITGVNEWLEKGRQNFGAKLAILVAKLPPLQSKICIRPCKSPSPFNIGQPDSFTIPRRVEGWVDIDTAVRMCNTSCVLSQWFCSKLSTVDGWIWSCVTTPRHAPP